MNTNEIGKVILRVMVGLTFFLHGLSKFQGGILNTVGYFDSIGIPGFLAYVIAVIELAGGIALIIGLGTRIITTLFAFIMLGVIFTAKLSLGFFGNGQMVGYELDLLFLAASIYFVFAEGSKISFDQMFFQKKEA